MQTVSSMSKFRICVFSVLLLMSFAVVSQLEGAVWADNDDENPNPQQLSGLRPCSIQEENVQGRTIVGTILADICQGTDRSETVLGLQDNDILSGPGANEFICGDGVDTVLDYKPSQGDVISNDCEIVNSQ